MRKRSGRERGTQGILLGGTEWTASAHIITTIIGSGVLSLGWAVAQLGWVGGIVTIFIFSSTMLYTANLLADCYRSPDPVTGKRNHTYMEAVRANLGYAAFGNDAPGHMLTGFGFYEPLWYLRNQSSRRLNLAIEKWPNSIFVTAEYPIKIGSKTVLKPEFIKANRKNNICGYCNVIGHGNALLQRRDCVARSTRVLAIIRIFPNPDAHCSTQDQTMVIQVDNAPTSKLGVFATYDSCWCCFYSRAKTVSKESSKVKTVPKNVKPVPDVKKRKRSSQLELVSNSDSDTSETTSSSSEDPVAVSQTQQLLSNPHYHKLLDGIIEECMKMKSAHEYFHFREEDGPERRNNEDVPGPNEDVPGPLIRPNNSLCSLDCGPVGQKVPFVTLFMWGNNWIFERLPQLHLEVLDYCLLKDESMHRNLSVIISH
uniref:Amino acid transporter transmembrane domain-containing protein n=1 Tax=Chenopodium quinoa TaxID=63459 RepID=A0A803NC39_CHEQI